MYIFKASQRIGVGLQQVRSVCIDSDLMPVSLVDSGEFPAFVPCKHNLIVLLSSVPVWSFMKLLPKRAFVYYVSSQVS